MAEVFVIIVTYNGKKWLDHCLGSLRSSHIKVHTIVVDNASMDGTADYIEQHYPEVELIRAAENLRFGGGNNIGLRKVLVANAPYVFLLNQDAWIEPDTLDKLVQVQRENPKYGILSPVHFHGSKNELEIKFAEYASPVNTPNLLSDLFVGNVKSVYSTTFVNAAAWLISNVCLREVGGFNPLFSHYGEDEDYVNRCRFKNFKIGIVPSAIIFHDSDFDWSKIEFNSVRNIIFNLIPLANVNHRFRSAYLLFLKKSFDELSGYLLFRKFKKFSVRHRAFWKTISMTTQIIKFRRMSQQQSAFL